MKTKVLDYDIIYLSYDEPNAEKNYADLCAKVPWAKRVHGVKGSDAAHKACAELSETDRFITVDGDNVVRPDFLQQEIDSDLCADPNNVISWNGLNAINGLMYGNGGLKCWSKHRVLTMRTHENADPENISAQVDFCWDLNYVRIDKCMSDVYNNATPQQAWRAGFREGVKLALDNGTRLPDYLIKTNHWKNLNRLYLWTMVGADVENGLWAIYGAREGLYKTMLTDWDYVQVRDFDYLNQLWETDYSYVLSNALEFSIEATGIKLVDNLNIPISAVPLNSDQSVFFKHVYQNLKRN